MGERGEDGQIGGIESLAFGVLVLVLGALLVSSAWGAIDAKSAAAAGAREAARAYVEAGTAGEADAAAQAAGVAAVNGHGRSAQRLQLIRTEGGFQRCARVTFEARYSLPVVRLPLLGQSAGGWTVRARHSELVDPYRSGLAGSAACG